MNIIEPGQPWTVDLFKPEDAPGVTALFKSVYGDGYPVKTYLNPDLLIRENAAGHVISSVARTEKGDIVGHNALFNSAPHTTIFESGAGLVHKDYRGGHGIFTQMVAHGLEIGKTDFGVELAYGEPVCNHPFSQKLCKSMDFTTRAVEVALMPAEAYTREKSAQGRVTTLLDFKTLKSKPATVYVPQAYAEQFSVFYESMDDERQFLISDQPLPEVPTRLSSQVFDFAKVARVTISRMGQEFNAVTHQEEKRLINAGIKVIQAWLPTGTGWVGQAVDILRARGYFIGGVLPRWFDTDGMLMEKILTDPCWDSMVIQFDRALELVELVRKDWEAALKTMPGHTPQKPQKYMSGEDSP